MNDKLNIKKICSKCLQEKDLSYFGKQKYGKYGCRSQCKECRKKEGKQYYNENIEKIRKYYEENKEKIQQYLEERKEEKKVYDKKYYLKNFEKIKEYKKEYDRIYRESNKEKIIKRKKEYYLKNFEKIKEYKKEHDKSYQENNREKIKKRKRIYEKKRRESDIAYRLSGNVANEIRRKLIKNKGTKNNSTWEALPYTPQQLKEHLENQFDENMSWENYGSYWQIDHIHPQSLLLYDSLDHPNFLKCWALENLRPLESIENVKKGNKIT